MKLAYLVNTYPRASHTFIRREIQALERIAVPVHRFAMRSDRDALVDAADIAEDYRTEHVLEMGLMRLLGTLIGWIIGHPWQSLRAWVLAWACGARGAGGPSGTGGRLRHLIYLVEAAYIARRCKDEGIAHLHAHFGTNSATVAMLAHSLGGPQFSFTVHGPEEFDAPLALSLRQKIEAAQFVVAISSFGRSQLCRWVGADYWDKIKVVHCGIEPDRFPRPLPLPQGGPHCRPRPERTVHPLFPVRELYRPKRHLHEKIPAFRRGSFAISRCAVLFPAPSAYTVAQGARSFWRGDGIG